MDINFVFGIFLFLIATDCYNLCLNDPGNLQDADDFYSWAKETQTAISYDFVFVEVQACPDLLRELPVTIVEGTMKLLYYA